MRMTDEIANKVQSSIDSIKNTLNRILKIQTTVGATSIDSKSSSKKMTSNRNQKYDGELYKQIEENQRLRKEIEIQKNLLNEEVS